MPSLVTWSLKSFSLFRRFKGKPLIGFCIVDQAEW
jgi:hypothetical protein